LLRNFLIADVLLVLIDMVTIIPCAGLCVNPLVPLMAQIYIKSPTVDFKLEVEPRDTLMSYQHLH
jgi:hypothetical protein